MKKWRLLLSLVALLLGAIILATIRSGPAEPVYQGRKLSAWIDAAGRSRNGEFNTNALLAVRAIGSNAIPWLLAELDASEGQLKRKINDFARRRKWAFRIGTPVESRHWRAVNGFCFVGPRARGAIPQLVERLGKDRGMIDGSRQAALVSMAHRGSSFRPGDKLSGARLAWLGADEATSDLSAIRREIIDRVRPVAAEADMFRRLAALQVLREVTSNTGEAVPIFLHALQSTNEIERIFGAQLLGLVAKEPVSVIPPLIAALNDPSPRVQQATAGALGNYFRQARTAVPALRKLSTNGVPLVQRAAADALQKIDPEGTAEADIRRAPSTGK